MYNIHALRYVVFIKMCILYIYIYICIYIYYVYYVYIYIHNSFKYFSAGW